MRIVPTLGLCGVFWTPQACAILRAGVYHRLWLGGWPADLGLKSYSNCSESVFHVLVHFVVLNLDDLHAMCTCCSVTNLAVALTLLRVGCSIAQGGSR